MVSEAMVEAAAAVISKSPLIDSPKLPPECWHGLARAALEAALSSAQAPEWQPIETAPDVGNVLVYGGRHAEPEIVCADGRWWRMEKLVGTPTHWMPLPAAPQPLAGKQ